MFELKSADLMHYLYGQKAAQVVREAERSRLARQRSSQRQRKPQYILRTIGISPRLSSLLGFGETPVFIRTSEG